MILFSTERMDIRRWRADDAEHVFAIYGDAEANRFVGDGQPLPLSECERWIDVTLANYANRGYGMSAIIENATGDFVGCCGIVHPDGQAQAEIKYAIRREQWGKGIASEVVPAMLTYGFDKLGLGEIIATVDPKNKASIRILEKSGMRYSRTLDNDDGTSTLEYTVQKSSSSRSG